MAAILRGSSHSDGVTPLMLSQHAPKITSALGHRGLQVLTPRTQKKEKQFITFQNEIVTASETYDTIVLQTLSNDMEKIFLRADGKGKNKTLLKLRKNATTKWLNSTHKQHANNNYRSNCVVINSAAKFVKGKLNQYAEVLVKLVARSKLKVVYQCSVLERKYLMYDETHLDILFAALNSYLEVTINNIEAKNSLGESVKFKFIRLTSQYHSETPFWGFRPKEVTRWRSEKDYYRRFKRYRRYEYPVSLTHRSEASTRELLEMINRSMA